MDDLLKIPESTQIIRQRCDKVRYNEVQISHWKGFSYSSTGRFIEGEGKKAPKIDRIIVKSFLTYTIIEIISNCLGMAV